MAPRQRSSRAALQAARNAFKKLDTDRERFQRLGLGPGEAYVGLWRICADYLEMMRRRPRSAAKKKSVIGMSWRVLCCFKLFQTRVKQVKY
jgi:hypothetical protein